MQVLSVWGVDRHSCPPDTLIPLMGDRLDKSPIGVTAEEGVRKLPGRLSGQRKVGHKKSMAGRGPSQTQH